MSQSYEASRRQIEVFARKVHRRLYAAGARSVQVEDVEGELNIAWCLARDAYDASKGVPFGAFLNQGMINHINRWAKGQISNGQAASLETPLGDEGSELHEIVPAECDGPDQAIERAEMRDFVAKNLSPRATQFVDLLDRPTDEILDVLEGMRAKAEYARSRGVKGISPVPSDVTTGLAFDFMGAGRVERREIYREVKWLSQKINQW